MDDTGLVVIIMIINTNSCQCLQIPVLHFAAKLNHPQLHTYEFLLRERSFLFLQFGARDMGLYGNNIYVYMSVVSSIDTNFGFASRIHAPNFHYWIDRNESLLSCYLLQID